MPTRKGNGWPKTGKSARKTGGTKKGAARKGGKKAAKKGGTKKAAKKK